MIQDVFFWAFILCSTLIYWLLPPAARFNFLSAASLAAIVAYDALSAFFIVAMSVPLYFALPVIAGRSRRAGLTLLCAIVALVAPLIFFKLTSAYGSPTAKGLTPSLLVPLGMSYYVFRLVSVAIDSYRTGQPPQSARAFFTYVFLFTIFFAGPIERYDAFAEQEIKTFQPTYVTEGGMRIATGLIKQTVLIDLIVACRDWLLHWTAPVEVAAQMPRLGTGGLWILLIATYLTSYLNLGAYTDIAVGSSRLLGYKIMENFNFPIVARSLDDYWRRWHISLTTWCQTYVYSIVLGSMRNPYIAVISAFTVMGLWHAITPNRFAWGLFNAAGLIAVFAKRRYFRGRMQSTGYVAAAKGAAGWVATQAYVTASFVFVINERSLDVLGSLKLLGRLIGM